MKVKRLITTIVISLMMLLIHSNNSYAELHLKNLNFDIQVNLDGSMDVTETWDIHISDTNTLYKTFNRDNSKFSNITNFNVKELKKNNKVNHLSKSNIWQYHIDKGKFYGGLNRDGQYEIAWGVGLDDSSDDRVYQITYRVEDVIWQHKDCSELYWQFIGDKFEISVDKINGTITLPNEVENIDDLMVWGHTKYLNGKIEKKDNKTVIFELANYIPNTFVEVRMIMPNNVFEDDYLITNIERQSHKERKNSIIEEENKWAEEANAQKARRIALGNGVGIGYLCILVIIAILMIRKLAKYSKAIGETKAQANPEKIKYFRELPDKEATPAEAIFIKNKRDILAQDFSKVFSSILLDLTLKKFIKTEEQDKTIAITIIEKDGSKLPQDEAIILDFITYVESKNSSAKPITLKDVEKYIKKSPTKVDSLMTKVNKIVKKTSEDKAKYNEEKSKQKNAITNKIIVYFIAIFALFMSFIFVIALTVDFVSDDLTALIVTAEFATLLIYIVNIILLFVYSAKIHPFTEKGEIENIQWKAFKQYMEDFSMLNEKEIPQLTLWEHYLVFATAFGIADKVLKQLKVKYSELENSDSVSDMVLFSHICTSNGFNTNYISSINSSSSHMYSSYSASTGGGGGFSGGGGGRRPVVDGGGGR